MHGLVDLGLVFTTALPPKDTMTFRDEGEISYALGKQGGTRQFCGVFHQFAILSGRAPNLWKPGHLRINFRKAACLRIEV